METKVNYTLVGLFVIVLGAALISVMLWLTARGDDRSYVVYRVYTPESVAGLNPKAAVNYRGVEVGRVRTIRLDPGNPELVELTLEVEEGTPIRDDTRAVLVTKGLTGLASIDLTGGSRHSPALERKGDEEYPVIQNGPSLVARLDSAFTTLVNQLTSLTARLSRLLGDGNQRAFSALLTNLATTTEAMATHQASIGRSLDAAAHTLEQSAALTEQIGPLLTRLDTTVAAVGDMSRSIGNTSETIDQRVDQLGGSLISTSNNLNQAIGEVRSELRTLSRSTQPEVAQLLGELRQLSQALQRLTLDLQRDPRVLLYGKEPARRGPGE